VLKRTNGIIHVSGNLSTINFLKIQFFVKSFFVKSDKRFCFPEKKYDIIIEEHKEDSIFAVRDV